jgi:hypothetical protein
MRWFTTFVLLVLVAAGAFWLWKGDDLAPKLGLPTAATATDDPSAARQALAEQLTAEAIRRIELTLPGQDPLVLTKAADGSWAQPGNWPVRQEEAADLARTLTSLRTLFRPIRLEAGADLTPYGLDPSQKPVVAKVETAGRTLTLTFGQPPARPDEPPTARPTYVRVDDLPEVLRLAPDVMANLTRPPDAYRGKRLFPDAERMRITGGDPPFDPSRPTPPVNRATPLLGDRYTAVKIDGPDGGFVLKRVAATPKPKLGDDGAIEPTVTADQLAAAWEIVEIAPAGETRLFQPLRDRADPAKLRAILTAVPDLWAEGFIADKTPAAAGLDQPQRTVAVTLDSGATVTLRIGQVSRTQTKVTPAPPAGPFAPPQPPTVTTEEYRYAKLDNNPLIFEIRTDRLDELFPKPQDVRDARLARFDTADVTEVTIHVKDKPSITLTKKKGNPDATNPADRDDRWYVGDILAERSRVTELLDQLSRLEARGEDVIDNPDAAKLAELGIDEAAGTRVTVTVQEQGEPTPPAKTFTFLVGTDDAEANKVPIQVAGWPSVNRVENSVVKLIDRPALAYRGRRLFDTAEATLQAITVTPADGPAFAVAKSGDDWKLTQPVAAEADASKTARLADDLSRLEVTEYVDDAPTPEDLETKYGLAKPTLTAVLNFTGPGAKEQTLEVGRSPEFKSEYYARLNGGSVFTIPQSTIDTLKQGPVALLPQQLLNVAPDRFTSIEVQRGDAANGESYTLTPDGTDWKLTGPFEAKVPFLTAQPLLTAVGNLRAETYKALTADDPAQYGFDKPALRLTLTYKDNAEDAPTSRTLIIGKPTDAADARYAQLEGGATQAVFTVPDSLLKEADRPALDLLDRNLLFLDSDRITQLTITGPQPENTVTLVKDEKSGWTVQGATFTVDKPTAQAAVTAFAQPTVTRLAAYEPNVNWAEYGLDQPEWTLTATLAPADGDAQSHTIKLGKAAPDGGRFARVDDGPAVAVLDSRAAADLARSRLDFVDRTLLTFDAADLAGIVRLKGGDELEIVPGATAGWDITKPDKHKADTALLEELAEQLARLRAVRVADYGQPDLAKYGLDDPAAVVKLTIGLDQPSETTLKIGQPLNEQQPDGERYVLVEGRPEATIGVLAAPLAKTLLADPLKFRDRTLARFVDADRVTIERGDRTVTFAKVAGTWKLVQPTEADAEQGELDELINALARLRADELHAEKPDDLTPFGLDPPQAKLTLAAGDKEVLNLLVGTKEQDGRRVYAKLTGGDVVALLDPATTGKVLAEYRRRAVWSGVDAAQIETIAVSSGTSSFSLRKVGTSWVDTDKPNEPIDTAKVSEFLDALAGLKAERFAADTNADLKLYGLDPPQRVIVLTQRGGQTRTLHLGRPEGGSDDKRVYARVDDKDRSDVIVLSEADTAKLTRDRAGFAAAK